MKVIWKDAVSHPLYKRALQRKGRGGGSNYTATISAGNNTCPSNTSNLTVTYEIRFISIGLSVHWSLFLWR